MIYINNFKILWYYLKDDKFKIIIYTILIVLNSIPSLFSGFFFGMTLETLISGNTNGFILYLLVLTLMPILFYIVLQIPITKIYNKLEMRFMKRISFDLYHKINNLPSIAFEDFGVGEFINRLYTDPDRVIQLLSKMIRLICKLIVGIIVLVISYRISFVLGIEFTAFITFMWLISSKFFPKIKDTQKNIKKETDGYLKTATENITGIREIKALGIKNITEKNISSHLNKLFKNTIKIRNYELTYNTFNNVLYYVFESLILFTMGLLFIHGKIQYSILLMVYLYVGRIYSVVESISEISVDYAKISVSLKRMSEILNNKLYDDEHYGNKTLTNNCGVINFNGVSFKYRDDEKYVLNDLTLNIIPNKKVAIVGRSGNGKSTIFNLLLRFFDTNLGIITIDDINIKDLSEKSLRNTISIIRQTPFLFNMSIIDNLRLVKKDATLKEIKDCCKKAYIDEYIESLPKKYDTIIGEGGINLSGGQKQRLSIARTLLINTKIILFDEATSALDNESQEYIKKTIDNLVKDHTVVIIAHRLSTIFDADIIHVVENGKVIDSGTHENLLKTSDVYQKLYLNEMN